MDKKSFLSGLALGLVVAGISLGISTKGQLLQGNFYTGNNLPLTTQGMFDRVDQVGRGVGEVFDNQQALQTQLGTSTFTLFDLTTRIADDAQYAPTCVNALNDRLGDSTFTAFDLLLRIADDTQFIVP